MSNAVLAEPKAPVVFNCDEGDGPVDTSLRVINIPVGDPDGGVNVRDGAAASRVKLMTAPTGTTVTASGGCDRSPDGAIWWEIEQNGVVGWANAKYLGP